MITVPSESLTFCKVRSVKPPVSNSRNGYSSGILPNSSRRPAGHQPPHLIPCLSAASSAARSTPVCPPEIIFTPITVVTLCERRTYSTDGHRPPLQCDRVAHTSERIEIRAAIVNIDALGAFEIIHDPISDRCRDNFVDHFEPVTPENQTPDR